MKNKEKREIGAVGALIAYIIVGAIVVVTCTIIEAFVLKQPTLTEAISKGQEEKLLLTKCFINALEIIIYTSVFMLVVRKVFIIHLESFTQFKRFTIVATLVLAILSMGVTAVNGYRKASFRISLIHSIENGSIYRLNQAENPEEFEGIGFAEGCKTETEIIEAADVQRNLSVAQNIVFPIVTDGVNCLVQIAGIQVWYLIIAFKEEEDETKESEEN